MLFCTVMVRAGLAFHGAGLPANRTIARQESQADMSRFVELTKTYVDIRVGL